MSCSQYLNRWRIVCAVVACVMVTGDRALATELKADEQVILFPTLGNRLATGDGWAMDIHGLVCEPENRRIARLILRKALGFDDSKLSAVEEKIFAERSGYFLADNERGVAITVRIGLTDHPAGRSAANGHFHGDLTVADKTLTPAGSSGKDREMPVLVSARDGRTFSGTVHLLETKGISVISDIDDTIKVSQVLDRDELLKNTFVRAFQPVAGMAEVYRAWATNDGASFHYLSASPWQLYVPLAGFVRSNGFPAGSFHLKQFRVKDETFLDLFTKPDVYKPTVIEPLLQRFPERRFVMVGDSGERDPEIYGALARKFPAQVRRIFIRDVTGQFAESERCRRAFDGVRPDIWKVFEDPAGLPLQLR
ncbi:MAG: App1 family protein [Opitutaceae bacterium]|nr:App1 family protein [Verrucomicrobiales bacterium]